MKDFLKFRLLEGISINELGINGVNLIKEKIMAWFSQNWIWVLFFIAFIAMHLFGHGGHGGHYGNNNDHQTQSKDDDKSDSEQKSGHQH